jgi:hypothetical protein
MEDETLEPEVKPIANGGHEGEEGAGEAGRRLGRREAAARMSAQSSEFADLVALKSHLPSAEFRSEKTLHLKQVTFSAS